MFQLAIADLWNSKVGLFFAHPPLFKILWIQKFGINTECFQCWQKQFAGMKRNPAYHQENLHLFLSKSSSEKAFHRQLDVLIAICGFLFLGLLVMLFLLVKIQANHSVPDKVLPARTQSFPSLWLNGAATS